MAFSGLDPAGGEGLRADITAIVSMGCRALSAITAPTVQGTEEERGVSARSPASMLCQRFPVSSPTFWKFP
jgi:hydroxymethylpyrimidine/phosphomethylpyrimidine kinase